MLASIGMVVRPCRHPADEGRGRISGMRSSTVGTSRNGRALEITEPGSKRPGEDVRRRGPRRTPSPPGRRTAGSPPGTPWRAARRSRSGRPPSGRAARARRRSRSPACRGDEHDVEVPRQQAVRLARAVVGGVEGLVARAPAPHRDRLRGDARELLGDQQVVRPGRPGAASGARGCRGCLPAPAHPVHRVRRPTSAAIAPPGVPAPTQRPGPEGPDDGRAASATPTRTSRSRATLLRDGQPRAGGGGRPPARPGGPRPDRRGPELRHGRDDPDGDRGPPEPAASRRASSRRSRRPRPWPRRSGASPGSGADVRFVQGDVTDLAATLGGPVDALFFGNAIHLVARPRRTVGQIAGLLVPGGVFAFNSAFFEGAYVPGTEAVLPALDAAGPAPAAPGASADPALARRRGCPPAGGSRGRTTRTPSGATASTSRIAPSTRCAWTSPRSRTSGATGSSSRARCPACRWPREPTRWRTGPPRPSTSSGWTTCPRNWLQVVGSRRAVEI